MYSGKTETPIWERSAIMQRIRTEILPGVWLTALRTDKFKTAWLSVNLLAQLRRETAACTAVLPYVLRRRVK